MRKFSCLHFLAIFARDFFFIYSLCQSDSIHFSIDIRKNNVLFLHNLLCAHCFSEEKGL